MHEKLSFLFLIFLHYLNIKFNIKHNDRGNFQNAVDRENVFPFLNDLAHIEISTFVFFFIFFGYACRNCNGNLFKKKYLSEIVTFE